MSNNSNLDSSYLGLNPEFLQLMGLFQATWAATELLTDYAIFKFLKVTPEQGHLITSGMMFGRKARLLADLIGRSDHPNKAQIQGVFKKIRGDTKRDIFAHAYQQTTKTRIRFVERTSGGEYHAKVHPFTLGEFQDHVISLTKLSNDFWSALACAKEDVVAFAEAAFSANRSPKTSPQ